MRLDKEDLEVLRAKLDADVECPNCKKSWHSPYPKTRKVCPDCWKKLTGYEGYID